jgi:neutral ceramidase
MMPQWQFHKPTISPATNSHFRLGEQTMLKPLSSALTILASFVAFDRAESADQPLEWKAGVASAVITPKVSMPMAGYAARKEPSEGTEQDLFAKALVIEDRGDSRVVFVTLDLIGVSARLRAAVNGQLAEKHKLPPQAIVMNASHTHCGPAYSGDDARPHFDFLVQTLVDLVGRAIDDLQPAALNYSTARSGFAMNRRTPTATGYKNHPNPDGPVDHSVPVLSVLDAGGKLRSVMFGYACHNTTMGFRKWLGDYAGYAQEYFEKDHVGVTAQFLMGCGGDQNPYPRSELRYAQQHGRSLATAVEAALETKQTTLRHQHPLQGPLQTIFDTVSLDYTDKERPPIAYPVQLVQFGKGLCIVALSSETVIDYSLRLKSELAAPAGPAVWIAGYSNVMEGYIPSRRVLLEGGYEAESRPWNLTLEERIVAKVHELYRRLNP